MKIGVIKEKKVHLLIISIIIFLLTIFVLLSLEDFQTKIVISILFIIVYLIILLNFSISMEWYIINEKSITVKNIYGVINKVEFKDVNFCYIKRLPLFTSDKGITCILFKDNRKENGIFIGRNIDNHKKYIVRIPYSQDIVDFLKNNNIKLNNDLFKNM